MENYADRGFIYERRSIILKRLFFQETCEIESNVHFQVFQLDVVSDQYGHLICVSRIKLIELKTKKKLKVKRWKMTVIDH